jgi:hypothetical protein
MPALGSLKTQEPNHLPRAIRAGRGRAGSSPQTGAGVPVGELQPKLGAGA